MEIRGGLGRLRGKWQEVSQYGAMRTALAKLTGGDRRAKCSDIASVTAPMEWPKIMILDCGIPAVFMAHSTTEITSVMGPCSDGTPGLRPKP